jgi:NodT family efflux transporter outer membrane factor (OMF) lipoprotein
MTCCCGLLCACTVGPDFVRPPAPAVTQYTSERGAQLSPSDARQVEQKVTLGQQPPPEWWRQFQSSTLDQVVEEAIGHNRSLAATAATLAQAQQQVLAASGALFPQIDFAASVGEQKYGAAFVGTAKIPPAFSAFSLGPSVSYALDIFGGIKRQIENQEALAEFQRYQLDGAYLMLTGAVVNQTIAVASVHGQIKAIEDILADDEENLRLVRVARGVGAVSDVDLLSAESQLANDRTLLPSLRQQLSIARHALAILAGHSPGDWSAPDFELGQFKLPRELPLSLPSDLVRERPDILAAEAQLHAASASIGVATANLYPQINLTGSLTQQALTLGHLFSAAGTAWSVAGGLTAPLFHGGELEAQRQAALDAYGAALATYEQTVLQAFGQVADVLQSLAHDAEQVAAQMHALETSAASLRLTRIGYNIGNLGILQVLDAQRLLAQARLGYVRAEAQRYLDTTQLFLALGGASTSPDAPVPDGQRGGIAP